MDCGNFFPFILSRIFKCKSHYSFTAVNRDRFYAYARILPYVFPCCCFHEVNQLFRLFLVLLKLYACIKVFRVFPHNNEVNILISCSCAFKAPARPQAAVKVKRLPQRNINAPESCANRCCYRPFNCNLVFSDGINYPIRQWIALFLINILSGIVHFPFNRNACCFNHAPCRFGYFRPNTITGN